MTEGERAAQQPKRVSETVREAEDALYDMLVVEPEPADDGMHYAIHGTVEGLAAAVRVLVGRLTEKDLFAVIEAGTTKLNPITQSAIEACRAELLARLYGAGQPTNEILSGEKLVVGGDEREALELLAEVGFDYDDALVNAPGGKELVKRIRRVIRQWDKARSSGLQPQPSEHFESARKLFWEKMPDYRAKLLNAGFPDDAALATAIDDGLETAFARLPLEPAPQQQPQGRDEP